MQITIGSRVTMHFAIRLAGGLVVESSFDGEPMTFTVGEGALDRGLELALIGLKDDDVQTLTLMPGQAFGERDEQAFQWIDRDRFPAEMELNRGLLVGFSGEKGEEVAGMLVELDEQRVRVDFNHPLAGREIEFEVHILEVENPPPE